MIGRLARLAAGTLLGVSAVVAVPAGPATAAGCPAGTGVTVVIDHHQLGGGVSVSCVADGGGRTAASIFDSAGISMEYVTRQPGFVCRVNGKPNADQDKCVNTPPSNAYWSLWSAGAGKAWTYATRGATSLVVPTGGFVAWSWQGQSGKATPGVSTGAAAAPAPAKPKPKPKPKPSQTGGTVSGGSKPTPTPSPSTAAEKRTAKATAKAKAEEKARTAEDGPPTSTSDDATPGVTDDEVDTASDETSSGSAGLVWVGGAVAVALLAGMGGMVWRRRTPGGSGS